jgi:hypothetical protein
VNGVDAVDHGDAEPLPLRGVLDGGGEASPLLRREGDVPDVEERADVVAQQRVLELRRIERLARRRGAARARDRLAGELSHLAHLLLERHLPQQRVHSRGDRGRHLLGEGALLRGEGGREGEGQSNGQGADDSVELRVASFEPDRIGHVARCSR